MRPVKEAWVLCGFEPVEIGGWKGCCEGKRMKKEGDEGKEEDSHSNSGSERRKNYSFESEIE
jgi:hypothetical protein